jgi:outer membrane usher protein FimD/PapC
MKDVSYTREGATEFHMQSPSGGFPPGEYRVELQVNGQSVGARDFKVVS